MKTISVNSILEQIDGMEFKAGMRHVRTAAGSAKFKVPIGSTIDARGNVVRAGRTHLPVSETRVNKVEVNHTSNGPQVIQHATTGQIITQHPNMASADAHIDQILSQHNVNSIHHTVTTEAGSREHSYRVMNDTGEVSYRKPQGKTYQSLGKLTMHRGGDVTVAKYRGSGLSDALQKHAAQNYVPTNPSNAGMGTVETRRRRAAEFDPSKSRIQRTPAAERRRGEAFGRALTERSRQRRGKA